MLRIAPRMTVLESAKHIIAFPPRVAPELLLNFSPEMEGVGATPSGERGMPGARCTRSRAWCGSKHAR